MAKYKSYTNSKVEVRSLVEDDEDNGEDMKPKQRTLSGYAVLYNSITQRGNFREVIMPGCFDDWINNSENVVKGAWNHNYDLVLGSTKNGTLELKSDNMGLAFIIKLSEATFAKDAYITVERGDVDGTSFGFIPVLTEWDDSDPSSPLRKIKKAELFEISPCTFPQYEGASSVSTRSIEDEYKEFLERNNKNIDAGNDLLSYKYKFL